MDVVCVQLMLLGLLLLQVTNCYGENGVIRKLSQFDDEKEDSISRKELIEQCDMVINNPVCKEDQNEIVQLETIRVFSGKEADPKRWPYMLSLQTVDESKNNPICRRHFCGATLIAPSLALTSAHCIWGSPRNDKRSPSDRQQLDNLTITGLLSEDIYVSLAPQCRHFRGKQTRKALQYYHPTFFSPSHLKGDIAILVLDSPFKNVTSFISYKAPDQNAKINGSTWLTTIGWGAVSSFETETSNMTAVESLQQGNVKYMDEKSCALVLNETNVARFFKPEIMFCAQDDSVDACLGDSGGPLVLADDNGEPFGDPELDIQVGIVSWGTTRSCLSSTPRQDPGIYTHILPFTSWIDNIVQRQQQIENQSESPQQEVFEIQVGQNRGENLSAGSMGVNGRSAENNQFQFQSYQFDNYGNLLL